MRIAVVLIIVALACAEGKARADERAAVWQVVSDWQPVATGIEFSRVQITRSSVVLRPNAALVRIRPGEVESGVRHFRGEGLEQPLTLREWQRRTGAVVVINAGQYDEKLNHLGYLIDGSRSLGSAGHGKFKGVFAAGPVDRGLPGARIFDLKWEPFNAASSGYRCALQSFMLLDRTGQPRVRKSGKRAERSVLAIDKKGRVLLLTTEGRHTLWDLAEILRDSDLGIAQAMSLDGGHAAQLIVESPLVRYDAAAARAAAEGLGMTTDSFEPLLPAALIIRSRAPASPAGAAPAP